MAQRSLSSVPSRIFTRKPSLAARIFGASLLALSFLVTLAGLGTAIYLEGFRDAATAAAPAQPAVLVTTVSEPAPPAPDAGAATVAALLSPVAAGASPPAAASAATDSPDPAAAPPEPPAAGSSAPLPPNVLPQVAALEVPSVTPSALGESGRYWVEYGVFVGERYAQHLQQALADHGLAASLVATHAPDGQPLIRVRSVALADHAEAREVAERARQALGIGPLVHRSTSELPRAPAALPSTSSVGGDQRYWVQFGAFPRAAQAVRVTDALRENGIESIVAMGHATSGRVLFLVRSLQLADRDSALALAHRGQRAASVDVLVGHTLEPRHGAATTPPRLADQSKDSPQRP